jgi:LysR family transcriptional regulator, nitrogen assimilation regulatory protein
VDTELLKTLVVVADTGSLSACASVMGIPQSLVSRRVRELERICAAKLLYRHGRGVVLTSAGTELYNAAGKLLPTIAKLLGSIADAETTPSGTVTIAISPAVLGVIGLQFLFEMQRLYPDVRIQLVAAHSRYILEWMIQGRIDVAILNDAGLSIHVLAEPLGSIRMVFVCAPAFEYQQVGASKTIRFDELGGIPLVMPTRGTGIRRFVDLAAAKGEIALKIVFEVDDIALTKELVASGKVGSLLPKIAVANESASNVFVERELISPQFAVPSVMATAKNRPITASMKATMSVLRSVITGAFS